jgi:hypothetical protein
LENQGNCVAKDGKICGTLGIYGADVEILRPNKMEKCLQPIWANFFLIHKSEM